MSRKAKNLRVVFAVIGLLLMLGVVLVGANYIGNHTIDVLQPKGEIAAKEKKLLLVAVFLSLFVVLPVYAMTIFIAVKYRAGNKKATYRPDWDRSPVIESVWWGIPIILIGILSVITWNSSHNLDPFKPLATSKPPINIQVVALQWNWLFIYPKQGIATLNYVQIPEKTPVHFTITSDAPMNSFWVPQLGGQIYAMSGMSTELHLMADGVGLYNGSSANISGSGFAGMTFKVGATSEYDFNNWVTAAQQSPRSLTYTSYTALAKPTPHKKPVIYGSTSNNLYDVIIMKYMGPQQMANHRSYGEAPTTFGAVR